MASLLLVEWQDFLNLQAQLVYEWSRALCHPLLTFAQVRFSSIAMQIANCNGIWLLYLFKNAGTKRCPRTAEGQLLHIVAGMKQGCSTLSDCLCQDCHVRSDGIEN